MATHNPILASQRAHKVRQLWQTFEAQQAAPRAAMNQRCSDAASEANKKWRQTPQKARLSEKEHNLQVTKAQKQIREKYFADAREEWQKQLANAKLQDEDWNDMTDAETKRVVVALGGEEDDANVELNKNVAVQPPQRSLAPPPRKLSAPSISASSSTPLLQCVPLPDDSVPHSGSIRDRLSRLDEMDPSESRILLFEKIHQEMWAELPAIEFIKWDNLPWPVFVRTTCPEDLMLHRIVSYLLQVSSGMDIKEALMDPSRLQWAQQRLRILLGHWGQPGLQKKVENSADKTMIQGVNVVTNHLKSVLDFVNTHQIDETHHTDLTAIVFQSFLKNVGQSLARTLTDTSDNSGYKSLLKLQGDSAQKMLNFLQTVCHVTTQYHHKSHYLQAA